MGSAYKIYQCSNLRERRCHRECSPVDVMLIANVPEKPDFALWCKHSYTQSMNRSISKPLIVEPPTLVQPFKVHLIGLATKVVQIPNLKVGEELTIVVVSTVMRIKEPVEIRLWMYVFWMCVDERAGTGPEGWKGASVVENVHVEAIFHIVVTHEAKHVVVNVAEKVNLRSRRLASE